MRHEQVRCACCGDVADGDQAAGWRVWFPLEWDLPAVLRPGGPARPVCHSGQRERAKTLRRRRAVAKRSKRAARRRG